jgi:beta-galactosidase/beta-glucuronidase
MDLGGTWRAVVADDEQRRRFAEPDLDDGAWEPVTVPGHWRRAGPFADSDGPLLYRTRFEAGSPPPGRRSWLVLDGIFYLGDVWLDGSYLGATEGYFNRHTFEVTDAMRANTEHVLAVEVTCGRPPGRNLTGAFQHDDPEWNPGGIWRAVRLESTGPVRARSLRMLCREATDERAVVALRAELDSDEPRTVELRTTCGEHVESAARPLALGSNFVEWTMTVPEPVRWWPAALGEPALSEVVVDVLVDDHTSHSLSRTTGFRSLSWDDGVLSINGERLFLKGASVGPPRLDPAAAGSDEAEHLVDMARDAGLDLLRLRGHVARPDVYAAADRAGLLIWQDLPIVGDQPRGVRRQAARQAEAAVDLLGHHPSLAVWCAHDGGALDDVMLDRTAARALDKADGTRPVRRRLTPASANPETGRSARAVPRSVQVVAGIDAEAASSLRRFKYESAGGFLLADLPLDLAEHRRPAACPPVIVVADRLPPAVHPGETLAIDVHVVSDLRVPLGEVGVTAHLDWPDGGREWRWRGTVPADSCVRVATVPIVVPDSPGPLSLELHLLADSVEATNRYATTIEI